jgi:hypothetical protein
VVESYPPDGLADAAESGAVAAAELGPVAAVDVTVAAAGGVADPVVEAAPEPAAALVAEPALEPEADGPPAVPAPATGCAGSVTSMYNAPAEPGSASTATAASHFDWS